MQVPKRAPPQELKTPLEFYRDVSLEELRCGLFSNRKVQMAIDLKSNAKTKTETVYKSSPKELQELKLKLKTASSKVFIRPSISLWKITVLFAAKKTE